MRAAPAVEGLGFISGKTKVLVEDAGFFGELLVEGATISSEGEWCLEFEPGASFWEGVFFWVDIFGISTSLPEDGRKVFVEAFGFGYGNKLGADEEGVVNWAGAGGPLCDGFVFPSLRACATSKAEVAGVCEPSGILELGVDDFAGLCFVEIRGEFFGCFFCSFGDFLRFFGGGFGLFSFGREEGFLALLPFLF